MQTLRKETVVIGYEESSQLDVEPAKYFVLVTKREKRACRSCEELGVFSAPLPPRIIEKCLTSDRIVIDTIVSKYCNHTPLHRQSVILERDICRHQPRDAGRLGAQSRRVADSDGRRYAAGVDQRNLHTGRRNPRRCADTRGPRKEPPSIPLAIQWTWRNVVFDFRLSRGRDGPKRFLG